MRRGAGRGFTLLEMIVVIAIMGIVSAMVMPGVGDGLRRWRLQASVREFATLLKFTRNQAVASRTPLEVVRDRGRQAYWLDRPEAGLPSPEEAVRRGVRIYTLPEAIRFGTIAVRGSTPGMERMAIHFFSRGNSSGGEIQIQDEKGRSYVISVEPLTGLARIQS